DAPLVGDSRCCNSTLRPRLPAFRCGVDREGGHCRSQHRSCCNGASNGSTGGSHGCLSAASARILKIVRRKKRKAEQDPLMGRACKPRLGPLRV
uniref:Uncharacterized protein n=1 Tax=Aegilops tauschii subsp. strangulata TaxID=200361 RepID=A0A453HWL9_AEGTS